MQQNHNKQNNTLENEQQQPAVQVEDQGWKPPLKIKCFVCLLYFIQGVVISIPGTMILVYEELPPHWILSIFAASVLPFSFKFITAPFMERYTSVKYGKRKTWIVLSLTVAALVIFGNSFLTGQEYEVVFAALCIVSKFFISLQDISLDALSVKELRMPYLASLYQSTMETVGLVFGSFVLLKSTSKQFAAEWLGLQNSITSASIVLKVISCCILFVAVLIHLMYRETTLATQEEKVSFCGVLRKYKYFFKCSSRYFRTFVMLLVFGQGFLLYEVYYSYSLVENGFSRNTLNTIASTIQIPIVALSVIVGSRIQYFGWYRSIMGLMIGKWIFLLVVLVVYPMEQWAIWVIEFIKHLLNTMRFILVGIVVCSFPVGAFSGMMITMLYSGFNIGREGSLDLLLVGRFGWALCAKVGLILQMIIILLFGKIWAWVQKGDLSLQEQSEREETEVERQMEPAGETIRRDLIPDYNILNQET